MKEKRMSTRYLASTAMFAAVSFVSVLIAKVIPNVAGFLSYEPKDAVIVIAGLLYGPMTSVLISVIVSLIEMLTISSTGPYGFLMNVVSTCAFAVPAAWFYQKHRTQKDAVIGLVFGIVTMAVAMLLWNYIITPYYMGVPRETVAGMLLPVFLPFNLVKGPAQRAPGRAVSERQDKGELQRRLYHVLAGRADHLRAASAGAHRCDIKKP